MWQYRGQQRPPFAERPGPGQESVWDYPRPPMLAAEPRRVVVRAGDLFLADSVRALRVLETASPPTVYVPAEDVDLARLVVAPGRSRCEWKGGARYWALRGDATATAVAWEYRAPSAAFAWCVVDCSPDPPSRLKERSIGRVSSRAVRPPQGVRSGAVREPLQYHRDALEQRPYRQKPAVGEFQHRLRSR